MKKKVSKICLVSTLLLGGVLALPVSYVYAAPTISNVSASLVPDTINLVSLNFTISNDGTSHHHNLSDTDGKIIIDWGDGRQEHHHVEFSGCNQSHEFKHGYHDRNGQHSITVKAKYKDEDVEPSQSIQSPPVTILPSFHFEQKISYQGPHVILTDMSWDPEWMANTLHSTDPSVWVVPGMYLIYWGDGTFTNSIPGHLTDPVNNKNGDRFFRTPHYYENMPKGKDFSIEYRVSYCNDNGVSKCGQYYSSGPITAEFESSNILPIPEIAAELKFRNDVPIVSNLRRNGGDILITEPSCVVTIQDWSVDPDYPADPGTTDGYITVWAGDTWGWGYDKITNIRPSDSTPRLFSLPISQVKFKNDDDGKGYYIWYDAAIYDKGSADVGDRDMQVALPWKKVYVTKTADDPNGTCGFVFLP